MVVALRAFAATFVATPAVFAKLAFHITNTAVYTMCTVVHRTLNTHMAFVTPRIIAFYAMFADIAPYYFVVNIAQIAAGAHHVIIKVTFIAHMVLSFTAFAVTFVAYSAIGAKFTDASRAFSTFLTNALCAVAAYYTAILAYFRAFAALIAILAPKISCTVAANIA